MSPGRWRSSSSSLTASTRMRQHVVSSFDALNRASNNLNTLYSSITLTTGLSSIIITITIYPSTSKRYNVVVNRKSLTSGWWWWKNPEIISSFKNYLLERCFFNRTSSNIQTTNITNEIQHFNIYNNNNNNNYVASNVQVNLNDDRNYEEEYVDEEHDVDEIPVLDRVNSDRRCECIECKVFPSAASKPPKYPSFHWLDNY